jgi:hypothetical protein
MGKTRINPYPHSDEARWDIPEPPIRLIASVTGTAREQELFS